MSYHVYLQFKLKQIYPSLPAPEYFRKKGVSTLTMKELFDFVTDVTITADNLDAYLEQCMTLTSSRTADDVTEQDKIDEAVRNQHLQTISTLYYPFNLYKYFMLYLVILFTFFIMQVLGLFGDKNREKFAS